MNYNYDSDLEYLLDTYFEKITFARFQAASQLNHAREREKGNSYEFKLFLILAIVSLLLYPLSIIMTMSGVFAIIGALLFIIAAPCTFFLFPVSLFKVIKYLVIRVINSQTGLSLYLKAKYGISTGAYEVDRLNELIIKYDAALSGIKTWKREMEDNELSLSEEEIKSKLERLDLDSNVDVVSEESDFITFVRKVTFVIFSIVMLIIILMLMKAYNGYVNRLTEMFRQI